jgi:hypothetical protein
MYIDRPMVSTNVRRSSGYVWLVVKKTGVRVAGYSPKTKRMWASPLISQDFNVPLKQEK